MKRILIAVLVVLLNSGIVYAEGYNNFKGSFSMYDVSAEQVIMKKIESQTDPATGKVMIDGKAMKFEYFENTFVDINGYHVGSVHFSYKKDKYVFDYYVGGNKVAKIVLFSKNGKYISKQIYPKKKGAHSDKKNQ